MPKPILHKHKYIILIVMGVLTIFKTYSQSTSSHLYHNFINNNDSIDFSIIDQYVKGKDIILLGEIVHGEKEITLTKTQIVKYLIKKHNFKIIAFESSFYDFFPSDNGIDYEKSIFPVWTQTKSFKPMLQYLHDNPSIIVTGFDNQVSYNGLDNLFSNIENFTKDINEIDKSYLFKIIRHTTYTRNIPNNFDSLKFKRIITDFKENTPNKYIKHFYDNILSQILFFNKYGNISKAKWKAQYSNIRDKKMAENLLFLYHFHKKKKIICWGANTHFANDFSKINDSELLKYTPMGKFLKDSLKNKLLSIGFSAKNGTFLNSNFEIDTVPNIKNNTIEDIKFTNNVKAKIFELAQYKQTTTFSNLIEFTPLTGKFNKLFDLVIIIDSISNVVYEKSNNSDKIVIPKKHHFIIKDAVTNEPLPFCNINYLAHKNIGAMSNDKGMFFIKKIINDTISISFIGYKTKKLVFKDLNKPVKLEPNIFKIKEITISAKHKNAISIMKEVIDSLGKRMNNNGYKFLINTHNSKIINGDTIYNISALKDVYIRYDITKQKNNLLQESYNKIQQISYNKNTQQMSTKLRDSYLNFSTIRFNILHSNIALFKKNKLKKYNLKINKKESSEKEYVIDFSSKRQTYNYTNSWWNKFFTGKIFIDKQTFGINRIDYTNIKDTAIFNSLILNKNVKRYSESGYSTSLRFIEHNNYYYLVNGNRIIFNHYYNFISKRFIDETTYLNIKVIKKSIIENASPLKKTNKSIHKLQNKN